MTMHPYFSIIIPSLNEAKYLPRLLTDLSEQTIKDFEVFVADAHSDDNTVALAKTFKSLLPKIKVVTSSKRNVSTQRNLGGRRAQGRYLLFIDADSQLPSRFLERLKPKLVKHRPDVFTTWCQPDVHSTSGDSITTIINTSLEAGLLLNAPVAWGALMGCTTKIFRQINGFNESVHFAEDSEFVRRAMNQNATYKIFSRPQYLHSLRRFRRQGALKVISQTTRLNLKNLLKEPIDQPSEYPMGGKIDR